MARKRQFGSPGHLGLAIAVLILLALSVWHKPEGMQVGLEPWVVWYAGLPLTFLWPDHFQICLTFPTVCCRPQPLCVVLGQPKVSW